MPKIQLSALISDIKGKSNGSVFSTNSGGNYFRNNPNGGGKKSAKWDNQKSKLITISQSWKDLDNLVQDAWNSAVNDFPTTNSFGATRIPTGYELYVRLNTVQLTYGNTLLVNPPIANTAPNTGSIDVEYPEQFQLNPQYMVSCFNRLSPIVADNLTNPTLIDRTDIFGEHVISFRIVFDTILNNTYSPTDTVTILNATEGGGNGWFLVLENAGSATPTLDFSIIVGANTMFFSASVAPKQLNEPLHIIIQFGLSDREDYRIYVNGVDTTIVQTLTGSFSSTALTAPFTLGAELYGVNQFVSFSDIRFFSDTLTTEEVELIYNGYILNNETNLWACTSINGGVIENEGIDFGNNNFEMNNYTETINYLQPCSFGLIPLFSLVLENAGSAGFAVNIYATPPISNGRTGKMSNYKLVGSFEYTTETQFFVYEELKNLFGNIAPNSQIAFYLQVYDTTTGVVNPVKQLANRKRPRFKAGSDLSTKVR
jgi:hypothetical protein